MLTSRQRATTAGRRMARTNIPEIAVIFRCSDAAWMAPFIRGFMAGYGQRTHEVTVALFAGGGNEHYFDDNGSEDAEDADMPDSPPLLLPRWMRPVSPCLRFTGSVSSTLNCLKHDSIKLATCAAGCNFFI